MKKLIIGILLLLFSAGLAGTPSMPGHWSVLAAYEAGDVNDKTMDVDSGETVACTGMLTHAAMSYWYRYTAAATCTLAVYTDMAMNPAAEADWVVVDTLAVTGTSGTWYKYGLTAVQQPAVAPYLRVRVANASVTDAEFDLYLAGTNDPAVQAMERGWISSGILSDSLSAHMTLFAAHDDSIGALRGDITAGGTGGLLASSVRDSVNAVLDDSTAGWDTDVSDDFDGAFACLSGIPSGLSDGDDVGMSAAAVRDSVNAVIDDSTSAWDKSSADDFDGAFASLSGIPSGLSDGDDVTTTIPGITGLADSLSAHMTLLAAHDDSIAALRSDIGSGGGASTIPGITGLADSLSAHMTLLAAHDDSIAAHMTLLAAHDDSIAALRSDIGSGGGASTIPEITGLADSLSAHMTLLAAHDDSIAAHMTLLAANDDSLDAHMTLISANYDSIGAHMTLLVANDDSLDAHMTLISANYDSIGAHMTLLAAHDDSIGALRGDIEPDTNDRDWATGYRIDNPGSSSFTREMIYYNASPCSVTVDSLTAMGPGTATSTVTVAKAYLYNTAAQSYTTVFSDALQRDDTDRDYSVTDGTPTTAGSANILPPGWGLFLTTASISALDYVFVFCAGGLSE